MSPSNYGAHCSLRQSLGSFSGNEVQTPPRRTARTFLLRRRAPPPPDLPENESTSLHSSPRPCHFRHDNANQNQNAPWFPLGFDDDDGTGRTSRDSVRLPDTTFVRPLFTPPRPSIANSSATPGSSQHNETQPDEDLAEPPEVVRITGQGRVVAFMDLVLGEHIPYLPEVLDDEPSNPGTRIQMKASRLEFPNLFTSRGWPTLPNMT